MAQFNPHQQQQVVPPTNQAPVAYPAQHQQPLNVPQQHPQAIPHHVDPQYAAPAQVAPQHATPQQVQPATHSNIPGQIGIYPQFVAQQVEQIILKEHVMSLSGDSFGIKTLDGRVVLRAKGNAFSLSGRKNIMDANGQQLFDIRKQHVALHATYYCKNPAGERILEVKSKFSIGTSKAIGTFTNVLAGGAPGELMMKGNFFASRAEITETATGRSVAVIDRQFANAAQLLGGKQTYVVTIQPGVDMALIAAMCICLDEKRSENKGY